MADDPRDQEEAEERERARPRVVDKRISARPAPDPSQAPVTPEVAPPTPEPAPPSPEPAPTATERPPQPAELTPEQEAEAKRIVDEIAQVPGLDWVLNAAVTLANVAGAKIQLGQLSEAQIALDALGAVVETLGPRLEDAETPLRQTLTQLRFAYADRAASPSR